MTVDNPASETKQRAEERKKCGLEDCYNDDEGLNDVKECMDGEPFLRPRDLRPHHDVAHACRPG